MVEIFNMFWTPYYFKNQSQKTKADKIVYGFDIFSLFIFIYRQKNGSKSIKVMSPIDDVTQSNVLLI